MLALLLPFLTIVHLNVGMAELFFRVAVRKMDTSSSAYLDIHWNSC